MNKLILWVAVGEGGFPLGDPDRNYAYAFGSRASARHYAGNVDSSEAGAPKVVKMEAVVQKVKRRNAKPCITHNDMEERQWEKDSARPPNYRSNIDGYLYRVKDGAVQCHCDVSASSGVMMPPHYRWVPANYSLADFGRLVQTRKMVPIRKETP